VSPSGIPPTGDVPSFSSGAERVTAKASTKLHGTPRKRSRRSGTSASGNNNNNSNGASAGRQLQGSSKAARFQAKIEAAASAQATTSPPLASEVQSTQAPISSFPFPASRAVSVLPSSSAPPNSSSSNSLLHHFQPTLTLPTAGNALHHYMPAPHPGGHLVWVHVPGQGILPAIVPQLPMFPPPGLAMVPMNAMQPAAMAGYMPPPGAWLPRPVAVAPPQQPVPPPKATFQPRPSTAASPDVSTRVAPAISRAVNICKKCHKPYMNPHHVRDRRNKWICMKLEDTPCSA